MLNLLKNKLNFFCIRLLFPFIIKCAYIFIPRKKNSLLIVKNDGIGDYILFRNYLNWLKKSEKFKDYDIYLLGNITFEDLACRLDQGIISGFYSYNDTFYLKWKLIRLLLSLQRLRPQIIIYTHYSRKYPVDQLIHWLVANIKIAIDGDTLNETLELKNKANGYYNQLLKLDNIPLHEFDKNKQIVEAITGEQCNLQKSVIDKTSLKIVEQQNVVVFPGGSDVTKRWPVSNYHELCKLIISKINLPITLAGSLSDVADARFISDGITTNITDKTGQLTLIQLCELIAGAKLLISNDTVAVHIAAALDIPVICIAKGDLYGRFIPYPAHISDKVHTVLPSRIIFTDEDYYHWSTVNIDEVTVADVFAEVENIFAGSSINNK